MKTFFTFLLLFVVVAVHSQTADDLVAQAIAKKEFNPKASEIKTKLTAALEINPAHETALYELATYHIRRDTDIYALPLLDRAIAINSNNAEYYWLRAVVNIRKTAKASELQQAEKDIDTAVALGWTDTAKVAKARKYIEEFKE